MTTTYSINFIVGEHLDGVCCEVDFRGGKFCAPYGFANGGMWHVDEWDYDRCEDVALALIKKVNARKKPISLDFGNEETLCIAEKTTKFRWKSSADGRTYWVPVTASLLATNLREEV